MFHFIGFNKEQKYFFTSYEIYHTCTFEMSTSNYFRALLLKALDNEIIPLLSDSPTMPHIYAGVPFNYEDVEHWTLQKEFLLTRHRPHQEIIKAWQEHRVKYTHLTRFLLIYDGVADIRVGIEQKFADQLSEEHLKNATGLEILRLPAASAVYFPPGIAYSNETYLFQENDDPRTANSRMLCIEISDNFFVSLMISEPTGIYTTHALQIDDKHLQGMANRYRDELEKYAIKQSWGGKVLLQKVLLAIVQRIRDQLKKEIIPLRNTAWPYFEKDLLATFSQISTKNQILWQHISRYIDMHLDYKLDWESLAKELGISAVHLNRIVRQATGTTTMRYVTRRRIDAAKLMLRLGPYPIKGIANFVGFRSLRSFSNSFKRHTGYSPREYRKQKWSPHPTKKWSYEEN